MNICSVLSLPAGLPGNVGAILASRISTALHSASLAFTGLPSASTDGLHAGKAEKGISASPRLVMITLCCVTLPIEVAFLAVLRAIGWLQLLFVFLAFSLIFFFITVSISYLSYNPASCC